MLVNTPEPSLRKRRYTGNPDSILSPFATFSAEDLTDSRIEIPLSAEKYI